QVVESAHVFDVEETGVGNSLQAVQPEKSDARLTGDVAHASIRDLRAAQVQVAELERLHVFEPGVVHVGGVHGQAAQGQVLEVLQPLARDRVRGDVQRPYVRQSAELFQVRIGDAAVDVQIAELGQSLQVLQAGAREFAGDPEDAEIGEVLQVLQVGIRAVSDIGQFRQLGQAF